MIKDLLAQFLMKNYAHIRVTETTYHNKYLIPREKPAVYKDFEPMFLDPNTDGFFDHDQAIKFITGVIDKLVLDDSYRKFTIYVR